MITKIKITLKRAMIRMRGILRDVVEEDVVIEVDIEDKVVVEEEASFFMECVIHVSLMTTIDMNVPRILHVLSAERIIAMSSSHNCMNILVRSISKRKKWRRDA